MDRIIKNPHLKTIKLVAKINFKDNIGRPYKKIVESFIWDSYLLKIFLKLIILLHINQRFYPYFKIPKLKASNLPKRSITYKIKIFSLVYILNYLFMLMEIYKKQW